jgi:hypothetical protein
MNQERAGDREIISEWENQADTVLNEYYDYEEAERVLSRIMPVLEKGDKRKLFGRESDADPRWSASGVIVIDDIESTISQDIEAKMKLPRLKSARKIHQAVETLRPSEEIQAKEPDTFRRRIGKVAVAVTMRLHTARTLFVD